MRDGFVVASCGLYLPMVAKSPESQTTTYKASRYVSIGVVLVAERPNELRLSMDAIERTVPVALSWSREEDIITSTDCGSFQRLNWSLEGVIVN